MGRIFKAIGKFINVLSFGIAGRIMDKVAEMSKNPAVIKERFNALIETKKAQFKEGQKAMGGLLAIQEKQKMRLEKIEREAQELEKDVKGSNVLLQRRAQALQAQGMSREQIEADVEFVALLSDLNAAQDDQRTVQGETDVLKDSIDELQVGIDDAELGLQDMARDIQKTLKDKEGTVADIVLAKQREHVAELTMGIGTSAVTEEEQSLRDLRAQARGEATAAEKVAGADTSRRRRRARKAAGASEAASSVLDGIFGTPDTAKPAATKSTELPD